MVRISILFNPFIYVLVEYNYAGQSTIINEDPQFFEAGPFSAVHLLRPWLQRCISYKVES